MRIDESMLHRQAETGPLLKAIAEDVFGMRVEVSRLPWYAGGELDVYLFWEPGSDLVSYSWDANACNAMLFRNGYDRSEGTAKPVPRWDLEIEPAWQVVERLQSLGWGMVASNEDPIISEGQSWAWQIRLQMPGSKLSEHEPVLGYGPTFPTAICAAARTALGKREASLA